MKYLSACALTLFALHVFAVEQVTGKVELSSNHDSSIHWRLVQLHGNHRSSVMKEPGSVSVPIGDYRVEVKALQNNWHVIKELKVEKPETYKVSLDTGIQLSSIDGVNAFRWFVKHKDTNSVHSVRNKWGFFPLMPGKYKISLGIEGQSNQVVREVAVVSGRVVQVDFSTGIKVKKTKVPPPERWMLKSLNDGGSTITIKNRWGTALVDPGEYWFIFKHVDQSRIQYAKVSVKKDQISNIVIDTGFSLDSDFNPEFYSLTSIEGNQKYKSRSPNTLYVPAGRYSLSLKMPSQREVLYEKEIIIKPGETTTYRAETGLQFHALNEPNVQANLRSVADNKVVNRINGSEGILPVPPGEYHLLVNTHNQSPIQFKDIVVEPGRLTSINVNSGLDFSVSEVFGTASRWNLNSVDRDAKTQVVGRWGKAFSPPGIYKLTLYLRSQIAVNYGVVRIPENDWLKYSIDSGVHINVSEEKRNTTFKIYAKYSDKPIVNTKLKSLYIPLLPGSYKVIQESSAGYHWAIPISVSQGKIVEIDEKLLDFSHSAKAQQLKTGQPVTGFNIARSTLGGRVVNFSSQVDKREWAAENLIDGFDYIQNLTMSHRCEKSCGWQSETQPVLSPEVTIGFFENRSALISAVVLDNAFKRVDAKQKYMPRHVSILVSNESPDQGFQHVADAELMPGHNPQLIKFQQDVEAKYVKIKVRSSYGGNQASIGEISVIESVNRPSILTDYKIDLARPENGGSIAWFSSQAPKKEAAGLVWLGDAYWKQPWHSYTGPYGDAAYLPQEIVFGFDNYQTAYIDRLIIDRSGLELGDSEADVKNLAKEIVIESSMTSPVMGFSEIARSTVNSRGTETSIAIDKKVKFLKLKIVSTHGKSNYVQLGKISILEKNGEGNPSILRGLANLQKEEEPSATVDNLKHSTNSEVEPNNQPKEANPLSLEKWVSGEIKPLGEKDYYRLKLDKPSVVTTTFAGQPIIQTELRVEDNKGAIEYQLKPNSALSNEQSFSLKLDAGDHYYHISKATNSIVLVWDTSGSMKGSEKALERAVINFVEQISPSEKVMLMRFGGGVKVLTKTFSNDVAALKKAASGQFEPDGGTPLYSALKKAMESLNDQLGNKVIVLMSDGRDTKSSYKYTELWHQIKTRGIRFYTLGLGDSLKKYNLSIGGTGQQMLDYMAMATNGKYWHTDSSDELVSLYDSVAKEITSKAVYHLKAKAKEEKGLLVLTTRDNWLSEMTSHQFEIILDASGSMVSKNRLIDGRMKIDVAKEVLADIVNQLPESSQLRFRAFGHRIKEYEQGDCRDTELIYSGKNIGKQALLERINSVEAKDGTTPLTYSILQAAKDLVQLKGRPHIVLVTDGQEYCGADPRAVVRQLLEHGIDIRIDIVGLDLESQAHKDNMRSIARMTNGEFYNISSSKSFKKAIHASLGATYFVMDAAGNQIAQGVVNGGALQLPFGYYHISVDSGEELVDIGRVKVSPNGATQVALVKNGQLIEVAAMTTQAIDRAELQSAKPASINIPVDISSSDSDLQSQIEQLERQILQAKVNRPPRK